MKVIRGKKYKCLVKVVEIRPSFINLSKNEIKQDTIVTVFLVSYSDDKITVHFSEDVASIPLEVFLNCFEEMENV